MSEASDEALTYEEAFRRYAKPAMLARYDELAPQHLNTDSKPTHELHVECNKIVDAIQAELVARLQRGELLASGLVEGGPITQGRIEVPAARWGGSLEFDHVFGEIWGEGFHLMDVRITQRGAADQSSLPQSAREESGRSRARIDMQQSGGVVLVGDQTLTFRSADRMNVVRQLVEAYHRQEKLRTKDLLDGHSEETLRKFFSGGRGAEAFFRLIRQSNGYCWLEP